jgi:Bacterial PH domain
MTIPSVRKEMPMKVYRSPSVDIATLIVECVLVGAAVFYWVNPGNSPDFGIGLGVFYALVATVSSASQIVSRLKVEAEGLAYVSFFRRKTISWSAVRRVGVSPHRTIGPLFSLCIETDSKPIIIRCVSGTGNYIERVAAELRAADPSARFEDK